MNCTVGCRIPPNWCNLWNQFTETLHSPNSSTTQTPFFLNVQSIRAHHDQLSVLIESFDNKPALIGLTETWLSDNDPIGNYNLEGYDNIVCANRVNARGGGVAAFI